MTEHLLRWMRRQSFNAVTCSRWTNVVTRSEQPQKDPNQEKTGIKTCLLGCLETLCHISYAKRSETQRVRDIGMSLSAAVYRPAAPQLDGQQP